MQIQVASQNQQQKYLWPSILGALLHGTICYIVIYMSSGYVVRYAEFTDKMNMKLPFLTEKIVTIGKWISGNTVQVQVLLVLLILVDGIVLYFLSRPGLRAVLREVWSTAILGSLAIAMVITAISLAHPLQVILEKLDSRKDQVAEKRQ